MTSTITAPDLRRVATGGSATGGPAAGDSAASDHIAARLCGGATCCPPLGGSTVPHGRHRWAQWLFARTQARMAAARDGQLAARKRALFRGLAGTVLEIGPGVGANLPYYPAGIHWIGVEPNPYMHPYLRKAAAELGLPVDLRVGKAEQLDVPDASVDAVVGTLVLCSVDDVGVVLREVQRVLRPGGQFLFLEHVAAPSGTALRRAQRLIRPLWRLIGEGCTLDRETWVALEGAGFASVAYQRFRLPGPIPLVRPAICGTAVQGPPTYQPLRSA